MVVRRSLSPIRLRGTHCRNVYATLLTVFLFLAVFLKQFFLLLRVLIQRVRGFGEDVLCKLTFYITLYGCNLSRGWVRIIPWTDQRRGTNRHYTDPRGRAWSSHYLECSAMSGPHPVYIKHQG